MIKLKLPFKFTALTLATISTIMAHPPVKANTFDETPVEQSQYVGVAQPYGDNKYNLIVIEQIPGKQACWSETGANPVSVEILLLNFDFTGHCRRSTDANGYSIRFNGQDLGLDYLLSVVERNGEIQLIGTNRVDRSQPAILVGTSQGIVGAPMKIQLNPGWRFSKRTYQGKVLGHVYFSYSDEQAALDRGGMMPSENDSMSGDSNLDSLPEGGKVHDVIAPETNQNQEMLINTNPKNSDSSEVAHNNATVEDDSPVKNNSYRLTLNRWQMMRSR